jgi:hypothetical protein
MYPIHLILSLLSSIYPLPGKYYEHLDETTDKNRIKNKKSPVGDILSGFYNVC